MTKTYQQISDKYDELVKTKSQIIKDRDSYTSIDFHICEVNAKMAVIDWIFDEVDDI